MKLKLMTLIWLIAFSAAAETVLYRNHFDSNAPNVALRAVSGNWESTFFGKLSGKGMVAWPNGQPQWECTSESSPRSSAVVNPIGDGDDDVSCVCVRYCNATSVSISAIAIKAGITLPRAYTLQTAYEPDSTFGGRGLRPARRFFILFDYRNSRNYKWVSIEPFQDNADMNLRCKTGVAVDGAWATAKEQTCGRLTSDVTPTLNVRGNELSLLINGTFIFRHAFSSMSSNGAFGFLYLDTQVPVEIDYLKVIGH